MNDDALKARILSEDEVDLPVLDPRLEALAAGELSAAEEQAKARALVR